MTVDQSLFQGLLRVLDWIFSAFKRSGEIIRQARKGTGLDPYPFGQNPDT